ncbi:MAG: protein of unknown function containing DUF1992 domain [Rhodobacteraceae bacterium HLUCCA08]|nr:MAG: protein of unknown function containing DUF1992 domain [Rhodobacteraceae bacterium HLUCCA08]
MDHPLIDLIDARIAAAEAEGAFDDLPGAGQPLPPCDDPENALLNRLMRDSGAAPEFVTLARTLKALRAELAETGDRSARRILMREMSMLEARIEMARRAWTG